MQEYLLQSEKDSETQKHIEVVFDLKKDSHKIALMDFELPTKKLLKCVVIKQINKDGEYVNHLTLKQKLTKSQIDNFKKYL